MLGDVPAAPPDDLAIPPPLRLVTKARPPWCDSCRHRSTLAFVDLADPELAFMSGFKRAHAIAKAREIIIHQGETNECVGVLYSGWIAKYRTTSSGERQLLSILLPGDLVGLEVAGLRSWFSLEALTDISICMFEPSSLTRLLAVPSLAARMLRRLASDKRQVEDRFAVVAGCDGRHGLAHLVLDLHRRLRLRGLALDHSLTVPLSRQQLAEAVGITSVHLHRLLRKFRREGVMHFERRRIVITNRDRLRELAFSPRAVEALPLI